VKTSSEFGQTVAKVVTWGQAQVAAAKAERQRLADPVVQAQERRRQAQLARERAEVEQIQKNLRFKAKLRRWSIRAKTGVAVAAGTATLGVIDTATLATTADNGVIPGSPGMWFVMAAISGLVGYRARVQLHNAEPPMPQILPVVPPPMLPYDAVGAAEAARLARAERQLFEMLPAVRELHPEAAESLRGTLASVQPGMYALVERLDVVRQLDVVVAPQAADAAESLRRRLDAGVEAYERLIAATAMLLAAPDPGGPASHQLSNASHELEAYAAGLTAASDAFDN